MSISLRILLGFGFSTLLMVAIGIYALGELGEVRDVTTTIVTRDMAAYRQVFAAGQAQQDMSAARLAAADRFLRRQLGVTAATAAPDLEPAIADWQRAADLADGVLSAARRSVETYAGVARSPARRQSWIGVTTILQQADEQLRRIRADSTAQLDAMRGGDLRAVLAAEPGLAADRAASDQLLHEATTTLDGGVQAGQERVQQVHDESEISVLLAMAVAVLVAVAVLLLIRRSIARPLGGFIASMERVREGDLTVRAEEGGMTEAARLGATLNRMVAGLRAITAQSREATANLNVSVAEIRASTQQQAAGVEEQLAAVQETAATVDEIAHSGAQISRRAQEVIASAQATTLASASGLHAVQETRRAMDLVESQGQAVAANIVSLSEKTQAIGEIVTSVNDISERTHLLALNAAIEAAAAGEQGRSFAVVASEMKLLADQAKEATQQVRSILGDIQRGINVSVMLTEEAVKRGAAGRERTELAEQTIEEMAAGIQEAVQAFQQIVASTNQQQLGIEQVMTALANIRQASQQTAAGTRELDAAALGLGDLSRRLTAGAERFRI